MEIEKFITDNILWIGGAWPVVVFIIGTRINSHRHKQSFEQSELQHNENADRETAIFKAAHAREICDTITDSMSNMPEAMLLLKTKADAIGAQSY